MSTTAQSITKVIVVNHALAIPAFRRRWKKLAEDNNYEVHLILPSYLEQFYFGEKVVYKTKSEENKNYHIHALETTHPSDYGSFKFNNMGEVFNQIKPDFIYAIGNEGVNYIQQVISEAKKFAPKAKSAFFTMNAKTLAYKKAKNPIKYFNGWKKFNNIKGYFDIAVAHYPGCLLNLRKEGFTKPIYLQTQVGVDELLFSPNKESRKCIREQLNWEDNFVIGFCGRLKSIKGVDTIVDAFLSIRENNENVKLLLVGNGDLKNTIEKQFQNIGLSESLHITDFIDQEEVPKYMNAMDTLVLGSKTTTNWIDTFPLVTVQAQATGVPVIASNSASIPWQLKDSALLFKESDADDLKGQINKLINDSELKSKISSKGRQRSLSLFCHKGMVENFKRIVENTISDEHVFHANNETYTQYKAY